MSTLTATAPTKSRESLTESETKRVFAAHGKTVSAYAAIARIVGPARIAGVKVSAIAAQLIAADVNNVLTPSAAQQIGRSASAFEWLTTIGASTKSDRLMDLATQLFGIRSEDIRKDITAKLDGSDWSPEEIAAELETRLVVLVPERRKTIQAEQKAKRAKSSADKKGDAPSDSGESAKLAPAAPKSRAALIAQMSETFKNAYSEADPEERVTITDAILELAVMVGLVEAD